MSHVLHLLPFVNELANVTATSFESASWLYDTSAHGFSARALTRAAVDTVALGSIIWMTASYAESSGAAPAFTKGAIMLFVSFLLPLVIIGPALDTVQGQWAKFGLGVALVGVLYALETVLKRVLVKHGDRGTKGPAH